ncbi:unnamed protein product, partial [Scytosiphon promiscuus]
RQIPVGALEKALLCVVEAIRCSGSGFVEGYRVKPTTHLVIRLVITLSECSPANGGRPSGQQQQQHQHQQVSSPTSPSSRNGGTSSREPSAGEAAGGSGLTAGTDALRLACLHCLEALLRAPSGPAEHGTGERATTTSKPTTDTGSNGLGSSNSLAWAEVRKGFTDAAGGGVLAQLVQELLLCCQQVERAPAAAARGGGPYSSTPAASTRVAAGELATWGGPEEARAAARCLEALCSFSPGAAVWRPLLPGTFSGLFRTIRGVGVQAGPGRPVGGGGVLSLGGIASAPQGPSSGGGDG